MKYLFNIIFVMSVLPFLLLGACVPTYSKVNSPVSSFAVSDIDYKLTKIDATYREDTAKNYLKKNLVDIPSSEDEMYDYVVGAGDMILINLYVVSASSDSGLKRIFPQAPALPEENKFMIGSDGSINIPYAGNVRIGGLPFLKARKKVKKALAKYFLEPHLEMNVANFVSSRALISGEVSEPQQLTLTHRPLTVMDAITQAKGVLPTADLRSATLKRKKGTVERIDVAALIYEGASHYNKLIAAGDTLTIPRNHANHIYMMGELMEPKTITINSIGMNLTEALGEVKGLNAETGDASEIYVLREHVGVEQGKRKLSIYHLDGTDPKNYVHATKFSLHPQDVIYVGAQEVTNWSRFVNQLLPIGFSALIQPAPYILN